MNGKNKTMGPTRSPLPSLSLDEMESRANFIHPSASRLFSWLWTEPLLFLKSVVIELSYPALNTPSSPSAHNQSGFLRSSLYLCCCNRLISGEAVTSVEMVNIIGPMIFFPLSDLAGWAPFPFLHISLERLRRTRQDTRVWPIVCAVKGSKDFWLCRWFTHLLAQMAFTLDFFYSGTTSQPRLLPAVSSVSDVPTVIYKQGQPAQGSVCSEPTILV